MKIVWFILLTGVFLFLGNLMATKSKSKIEKSKARFLFSQVYKENEIDRQKIKEMGLNSL